MDTPSVLVCGTEAKLIKALEAHKHEFELEFVSNGKDAQSRIYHRPFSIVFLDIDLQNHSGIEVLHYIRATHPHLKVVLIVAHQARLAELGLTEAELKHLGISDVLVRPFPSTKLIKIVEALNKHAGWQNVVPIKKDQAQHKEYSISDKRMTRVHVNEFFCGEISVFDIYAKITHDRYFKILQKGEPYQPEALDPQVIRQSQGWLYFQTSERAAFINYLSAISDKVMNSEQFTSRQKIGLVKNMADHYISEIYTNGMYPAMVVEGKKLCNNMMAIVQEDKKLQPYLLDFESIHPEAFSESFLTAFFASMIAARLPWGSKTIVEKTVLGALLHDIGKLRLPLHLREKSEDQLSKSELAIWQQHPKLGVEMLDQSQWICEAVKQIVYQHHELVNGSGFPNGLTRLKIYPLAKVVAFANGFVGFIRHEQTTPLEGIKAFMRLPDILDKYDASIVKSFLSCFIGPDKGKKGRVS